MDAPAPSNLPGWHHPEISHHHAALPQISSQSIMAKVMVFACSLPLCLRVALLQSETSPKPAFDVGRTFSEAKSGYYLYQKYVYPWEEKKC